MLALTFHNHQRMLTASGQESYLELKCLIPQKEHSCTEMNSSIHFQGCTKAQGGMCTMTMKQMVMNVNVVCVVMVTVLSEELEDTLNFNCSLCKCHGHVLSQDCLILITCLLTPWSRVLLEKLASLQLVKKFPAFYGTRRFLTALTSACHLSLS